MYAWCVCVTVCPYECGPASSFQSLWLCVSASPWMLPGAVAAGDSVLRWLCIVFQWRFRSEALMNAFSQEPQLKGLSPLCCRSWSRRWDLCLKAFSHIWHPKGLSLLWTLSCRFKSGPRMNALPQTRQRCGLKPVWIFRCSLRWAWVVKVLGHTSQSGGRTAGSQASYRWRRRKRRSSRGRCGGL
uniref:Uncharacterized protein n=1 Tax=Oncorhynchus kisutch TaxID=8019 RepID=A0A8C7NA05_ONCKI